MFSLPSGVECLQLKLWRRHETAFENWELRSKAGDDLYLRQKVSSKFLLLDPYYWMHFHVANPWVCFCFKGVGEWEWEHVGAVSKRLFTTTARDTQVAPQNRGRSLPSLCSNSFCPTLRVALLCLSQFVDNSANCTTRQHIHDEIVTQTHRVTATHSKDNEQRQRLRFRSVRVDSNHKQSY